MSFDEFYKDPLPRVGVAVYSSLSGGDIMSYDEALEMFYEQMSILDEEQKDSLNAADWLPILERFTDRINEMWNHVANEDQACGVWNDDGDFIPADQLDDELLSWVITKIDAEGENWKDPLGIRGAFLNQLSARNNK